ncbi:MAG TPA: hypothetical protein VF405_16220 [Gammaproteobacteria bacterium]
MKRPSLLTVALVLFVLLVTGYIVANTEWGEVKIPTPLRGDAATNPFYAAQKLVETLGATSERRESLGEIPSDAVVVLSTWGWDIDRARRERFERWVEAGGRLVVDAALISGSDAFETWSGIARERDEVDPDDDEFHPPQIFDPCRDVSELPAASSSPVPDFEVCNFDRSSWLATEKRLLWALDDEGTLVAARVAVGEGSVTVLNGVPFVYREIFEGEHGAVLAAATGLRSGDRVVFMSEADVASLPELVWQYGAPVVAVLLLWTVLALWRGAMRFGPLVAPSERARRSLAEQVLGTGRFALRVGGGAALVAAARRALHEAAARRIVGYERLAAAAQAEAIAGLARIDASELAAALDTEQSARPLELRAKLARLEAARRELVSRNQWSKHGKRI